jgi:hypothetical protein
MSDNVTLPDRLLRIKVRNPNAIGTHSEACWQWHDDCALLLASDRLAALTEQLRAERDALRANRDVWMAQTGLERKMRNEAESRLAALTDAIDTACRHAQLEAWEAAFTRITDAAAVQPLDPTPPPDTIAARHQAHYRYCECLGDSSECCDARCPCHDETPDPKGTK